MIKVGLMNASPKSKESVSGYLLKDLKDFIRDAEFTDFTVNGKELNGQMIEDIGKANVLIFSFPLYVDGVPSHLLYCLLQMEQKLRDAKADLTVYAIVNCGFYEGHQSEYALQIIRNWCEKAKITWGQGLGIGAGPMIAGIHTLPHGAGPKKNITSALKKLADNINNKKAGENFYTAPNFPRFLYKIAGEFGWRKLIKTNGLRVKDLRRRL